MSTDKGTYNKFDGSKKPSFNKFSKDGNSTGSFKRKFDGDNKSGFDNKRFKDNKFGSKDKKPVALDKKARLELRKQRRAAKPNAEYAEKINRVYKVNISHMKKDERITETGSLLNDVRGKIYELSLRHDSSRSLQLIVKHGSVEQRQEVFNELATHFRTLALNKTGHFIVLKMAQYCTASQRSAILQELRGALRKISLNPDGAQVLDQLYMTVTKPEQYSILREFIDTEYAVFSKSIFSTNQTPGQQVTASLTGQTPSAAAQQVIQIPEVPEDLVKNLLNNAGPRKSFILDAIEHYINRAIEKEQLMFRYVHSILLQYLKYTTIESSMCREIIGSVSKYIPALHHSREGVFAAIHCLAFGTNKDRKSALKAIKGRVVEFCLNEYAYLIVLRMIDVIDDTNNTRKTIINELLDDAPYGTAPFLTQLSISIPGSKVLLYFVAPKTSAVYSQHELEYLAAPMAPAYLFAKTEKEDKDDESAPTKAAPLVPEEELEGLPAKERDALIAKAEKEAAEKRLAAKQAEESERSTRSADDLKLVCTYKKDPQLKAKELAPAVIPALLKSFLYSQSEATGQKGKATGATSNISLEEQAAPEEQDEEQEEGQERDQDLDEITKAEKDKEAEIVFTKSIPNKPFGYIESLLRHRVGLEVVSYAIISGLAHVQEQAELEASGSFVPSKKQAKPYEGVTEVIDEVFQGIEILVAEGEEEKDFIVCDPRGHLPIKRMAKLIAPLNKRNEFNTLLWSAIKPNIKVIAASGRGCFVLLAMYADGSAIADEIKKAVKPILPGLKKAGASSAGFNLFYDVIINGKAIENMDHSADKSTEKSRKSSVVEVVKEVEVEVKKSSSTKSSSKKEAEVVLTTQTPRKRRRNADLEIASESDAEMSDFDAKTPRRTRRAAAEELPIVVEEEVVTKTKKSSASKKSSSKRS